MICVHRKDGGAAVKDKKVSVRTKDDIKEARTDSQGQARIDLPSGRNYAVYVENHQVYEGTIVGTKVVSI